MSYQVGGDFFPGKLQAIAIIQTVVGSIEILGSIFGFIWVLAFGLATLGIGLIAIPIPFIFLVVGILSLISGIKGLQKNPAYGLCMTTAIGQMLLLLSCDVLSFAAGLTSVILLTQDEAKEYFGRR